MRVHHNVCCGIEVHKKSVTACLVWGPADKEPQFEIRRFGTMTRDLQKLTEWLKQAGCEAATMESTGSYWKPVWNVLDGQIAKLILANAQHVRALPGEKTDRKDGKRLAELTRHGQVRPSYVPPRAILELRDLTLYRSKLLSAGSSERNRIQKVLEDANIKLGAVLSDLFGVSGQKMLQALSGCAITSRVSMADGDARGELPHVPVIEITWRSRSQSVSGNPENEPMSIKLS